MSCPETPAGVRERHDELTASVGGVRLPNPNSLHAAIYPANVKAWRNRGLLFEDVAQPALWDAAS
ncbi:hypothetical protein [Micromonospora ureilytica]|uniref:hypothetical protein n=1 Tax=Micromonospora ureilytica TaxID=709868 RepID=UPI002E120AB4|nr:hypothetical protein OHB55_12310 [Micromonospora ureilytica]